MTKVNKKLILYFLSSFMFVACAAPQVQIRTVYQEVFIPSPCDVEQPPKPKPDEDVEVMIIDLIGYTKLLEIALKTCKTEVINSEREMD